MTWVDEAAMSAHVDDSDAFYQDVSMQGLWRCRYCIDNPGVSSIEELHRHSASRRHLRLRDQYIEHGNAARGCIVPSPDGDRGMWRCDVCSCPLESMDAVDAHLVGTRHRRNLRRRAWQSASSDPRCDPGLVVHCIGDSHGGKYLFQNMAPTVRCHFVTGSMWSFASGRRPVNLRRLGVKAGQAVLFSYGEIDVRCYIERYARERGCGYRAVIQPLVKSYFEEILRQLAAFDGELISFAMAVPPPSDKKENPQAPFYGTLSTRIEITRLFNGLLQSECRAQLSPPIHFFQPFSKFLTPQGSLNHRYSDGHVHVRSECCDSIHRQLAAHLASICNSNEYIGFIISDDSYRRRQKRNNIDRAEKEKESIRMRETTASF